MKVVVALVMGFFSAFLIYMAAAMVLTAGEPSSGFVFVTFFGGWAISVFILLRGAKTVSKVFSRGFLLGAAEWLAIIPVGLIFSSKALTQTVSQTSTDAERAGAAIGAGLFSFITGGIAIGMAIACLIGFTVSYLIAREMKPESSEPTRKCPECAELIQTAARRCKHCGAVVQPIG